MIVNKQIVIAAASATASLCSSDRGEYTSSRTHQPPASPSPVPQNLVNRPTANEKARRSKTKIPFLLFVIAD